MSKLTRKAEKRQTLI